MKKKNDSGSKLARRVLASADTIFWRFADDMEAVIAGHADYERFSDRFSALTWSILDTVEETPPALFQFTPGEAKRPAMARDLLAAGLGAPGADFEVMGIHLVAGLPPEAREGSVLVVGWYIKVESHAFLIGCRVLVPRAAEIARAWVLDAVQYAETTPPERYTPRVVGDKFYRFLCTPPGKLGDPVTRFRPPSEWAAVIPNASGERPLVDLPEEDGLGDIYYVMWYAATTYDPARLASWVGFRAIGRPERSRHANSRSLAMLRCINAREVIALAQDGSDMAALCENVSDLRLLAGTVADYRGTREELERGARAVPTLAEILAEYGVGTDGSMPAADDERLLRHPVAMLLLSAELEESLGRDTPIGAARLQLASAGGEAFAALEIAWRCYRAERRYLATYGPGPGRPRDDVRTERGLAWVDALRRLLDARFFGQPLTSLRSHAGKPLTRILTALKRGDIIASDEDPIRALPQSLSSLYSTSGFGPNALEGLASALWFYAHTWRMQISGCTPEMLAEAETRGASANELVSSLDDLARLFE